MPPQLYCYTCKKILIDFDNGVYENFHAWHKFGYCPSCYIKVKKKYEKAQVKKAQAEENAKK